MSYETELNDSFASADVLGSYRSVIGQLSSSSDYDYYKFSVTTAGVITLSIDPPTTAGSYPGYTYSIYDSNRVLLGTGYGSASQGYVPAQGIASKAGDYYAVVSKFYSAPTGLYELTISAASASSAFNETELNDSFASADVLGSYRSVIGQLSSSSDYDYYKFSVTTAGVITLSIDPPTTAGSYPGYTYSIYDSNRVLLGTGYGSASQGYVPAQGIASKAGDYYAVVSKFYSAPTGLYELNITVPGADVQNKPVTISSILYSRSEDFLGLYKLTDGNIVIAAGGLSSDREVDDYIILRSSVTKAYTLKKAVVAVVQNADGGYGLISQSGKKFREQKFNDDGILVSKNSVLTASQLFALEVDLAQDFNADGIIGATTVGRQPAADTYALSKLMSEAFNLDGMGCGDAGIQIDLVGINGLHDMVS